MRAFLLSALIGLIVGVVGAQTKPKTDAPPAESKPPAKPQETTLTFPKEGERWWWTEDAQGEPLNAPQKTRDASVRIQLPANAETLWVYEAASGNLAQLKVADLAEKTEITSDRWTHVARVQVNLKAQEKPVASALVSLTDAKGNTTMRVLEPSAEGVLVFERVPLGKVEITARYGEDQKASQETTLKAERDLRVPVIELALSGTVATLEPKATAEKAAAETEQASPVSRIGAIVMFIIALILAVGVIVVLVRLALQRPQQLGEAMSKLGVELPQAATSGASATAAPQTAQQPDLPPLDTAGVPPTATVAPAAVVAAGPATRIVATQGPYAGQAFDITGDLVTIGREPIHPIALVNDMGVSRTHAQVIRQGDQTLIEDLGSTNGTYVNGVRISAPTPIKPGDTLQLGASLFRVE